MIRAFVGSIIRKGLSVLFVAIRGSGSSEEHLMYFNDEVDDETVEGYFTVLATKGKETRRFSVELDCLTDPAFLGLLDQAEEEYGFRQKGAISVPCRPQELQKILDDMKA
ncbi:auxin-responsive protein SAUR72-like [Arachis stenosperma]|uniref:auxin-responsive protein SAUR72-like n=1 Tax=Arachis stenosperma TaxID=217475 RepID=UPI0025AB7E2D|nr:auxin-responsive protein SAUR72-like [Arachis stenosperma]